VQSTLSGFAVGMTVNAMSGGKLTPAQVATNAFGNALGNSIVGQIQAGQQANALRQASIKLTQADARRLYPDVRFDEVPMPVDYSIGTGSLGGPQMMGGGLGVDENFGGGGDGESPPLSFAEDTARRKAALKAENYPMGLPMGGSSNPGYTVGRIKGSVSKAMGGDKWMMGEFARLNPGVKDINNVRDDRDYNLPTRVADNGVANAYFQLVARGWKAAAEEMAKPILPDLPELGGRDEYKARAKQNQEWASKLEGFAAELERTGGPAKFITEYRRMAAGYEIAREADLEKMRSITTYVSKWSPANPPEMVLGRNWSFMGGAAADIAPGPSENRTQAEIDKSLNRTTWLIAAAPVVVPAAVAAVAYGGPVLYGMGVTAQTAPLTGGVTTVSGGAWAKAGLGGFFIGSTWEYATNPEASPASVMVSGVGSAVAGTAKLGMNAALGLPNQWVATNGANLATWVAAKDIGGGVKWVQNAAGDTTANKSWWTAPISTCGPMPRKPCN
jgi:hypothetical protein